MRFLREMWESINYKGYEIEYNQDTLDQAIQDAKEEGELHFTFNFFIAKNGKRLHNTKSIKEAKAWIDNHMSIPPQGTPMSPEQFIEFCVSHGVDMDDMVYDWIENRDVSLYTLKDWIDLTLNTYKDHVKTMMRYNSDGSYDEDIKNCREMVIKPLETILHSNN